MNEETSVRFDVAVDRCQCVSPACPHPVAAELDTNAQPERCMTQLDHEDRSSWHIHRDALLCQPCYNRLSVTETVFPGIN